MGRRRRWKSKGLSAPIVSTDADPATRSIAINDGKVALAAGRRWRVIDVSSQTELHIDTSHEGAVRGIQFSNDGQYVLTCGDDKTARSWRTADWTCSRVLKSSKKASACAFSADGQHMFFADRFGDVLVATTAPQPQAAANGAAAAPAAEEANLLLGHLQAIITSLTTGVFSSSGQPLIISTDRDGKVRASVLPGDPTKGSYEIQSYCLGHTNFVTCSAAVPAPSSSSSSSSLLLSGGGDGTVRLWNVDTGKQLASYVASEQPKQEQQQGEQQQQQEAAAAADDGSSESGESSDSESEDAAATADTTDGQNGDSSKPSSSSKQYGRPYKRIECAAVLSVAVSPDGCTVAAAVEGQQEVQILQLQQQEGQDGSGSSYSLQLLQKLQFEDVANPAALAFDSQGRLWVVGGVLLLETESAHVGVAARDTVGGEFKPVTSQVLPDSLRAYLECRVAAEEEGQAGQQVGSYYHEGFKRKVYTQETLDERKKLRTDYKEGERLKAMFAAGEQLQQQTEKAEQTATDQQQ